MFNTDPLAQARYEEQQSARLARLTEAFAIQPHTGHKVGHKYDKK